MAKNKVKRFELLITEEEMVTLEEMARIDEVSKGQVMRFALSCLAKRKRYAPAA